MPAAPKVPTERTKLYAFTPARANGMARSFAIVESTPWRSFLGSAVGKTPRFAIIASISFFLWSDSAIVFMLIVQLRYLRIGLCLDMPYRQHTVVYPLPVYRQWRLRSLLRSMQPQLFSDLRCTVFLGQ